MRDPGDHFLEDMLDLLVSTLHEHGWTRLTYTPSTPEQQQALVEDVVSMLCAQVEVPYAEKRESWLRKFYYQKDLFVREQRPEEALLAEIARLSQELDACRRLLAETQLALEGNNGGKK